MRKRKRRRKRRERERNERKKKKENKSSPWEMLDLQKKKAPFFFLFLLSLSFLSLSLSCLFLPPPRPLPRSMTFTLTSNTLLTKKKKHTKKFFPPPDNYHYCPVPHSGQDAILFVGLSVVAACVLRGKLGTTMLLLAGAALEALTVIPGWTLGRLGNSISWFLSIVPYELFFYIFLPPLLLDAGARIDYFLFKRALLQVLTAAFLVVGFTTAAMIPLLLYVLRLADRGWGWQHVALLGSMLASTDAVAIINVMKERGGPRRLRVLLEGESLLNDASSFTLFSIFLSYVLGTHGTGVGGIGEGGDSYKYKSGAPVGWKVLGDVVADMLKLALGGFLFGVAFGLLAHWVLKFMRRHRAGIDQQVALTLAGGYLSFYTANSFHLSGVVAVAVFGLYGASTSTWDLPPASHGAFEAFWDALSFVANSIVFFFTGVRRVFFFRVFCLSSRDRKKTSRNLFSLSFQKFTLFYLLSFPLPSFQKLFTHIPGRHRQLFRSLRCPDERHGDGDGGEPHGRRSRSSRPLVFLCRGRRGGPGRARRRRDPGGQAPRRRHDVGGPVAVPARLPHSLRPALRPADGLQAALQARGVRFAREGRAVRDRRRAEGLRRADPGAGGDHRGGLGGKWGFEVFFLVFWLGGRKSARE